MDDIPGERWLPIPGYDSAYDVSDAGRVRSWKPWRNRPLPSVLGAWPNGKGYPSLILMRDGRRVHEMVPHLVLRAFVGPRPDGLVTRHLDGDKLNNALANLAYGTYSENMHDRVRHGEHYFAEKTHCKHGHPFDEQNTGIRRAGRYCKACRRRNQRVNRNNDRYRAMDAERHRRARERKASADH
jgi:hypothetical protein